jgi:hypothetical protein
MKDQMDSLLSIVQPLHEDVVRCTTMLDEEDSAFWRRALVRALFAELEGATHCMKQVAFISRFRSDANFSIPDKIVLLEQAYELDEKGEAKAQSVKIKLTHNIRFAFKAFARAGCASYDLKVDGVGWQSLKKGIKIRDRLTHPKKVEDLNVSDQELEIILEALSWFTKSLEEVVGRVIEGLKGKQRELEEKESLNPS